MRHLKSLIFLLAAASPALAQRDTTVVSRQLALAIARFQNVGSYGFFGSGAGDPTLTTDLPSSLAPIVPTPPRGSVLGSLTFPRMTDVFGTADGSVESVRVWFADEFKRRGYFVTNDETERMRFGGFADPSVGAANRGGYCAQTDLVNLDLLMDSPGRVDYRVRISKAHQNCRNNGPQGRPAAFVDPPQFPTLLNPANAITGMGNYSFGGCDDRFSGSSTATMLTTTMSTSDLIKHYDRQMLAAGWKPLPVQSTVTSTWSKLDAAGDETIIKLTASGGRSAPNCRYIEMGITRPPTRIK